MANVEEWAFTGYDGYYVSTGQEIIFRGQTETAKALGISIASVSNVLRGKVSQACGYRFEYIPEEGDIHD